MYNIKINYTMNLIKVAILTLIGIVLTHYGVTNYKDIYTGAGIISLSFALIGLLVTGLHYFYNKKG